MVIIGGFNPSPCSPRIIPPITNVPSLEGDCWESFSALIRIRVQGIVAAVPTVHHSEDNV